MRSDKENIIVDKTFQFALAIVAFCELLEEHKKYIIARQLLKSGTSIDANIREAQNAESKADFIHKFKISAKEIDETKYWLSICQESKNYPDPINLIEPLEEITKITNKIISSSKRGISTSTH